MKCKNVECLFSPVLILESDICCCGYKLYFTCEGEQYARTLFTGSGLEIFVGAICDWPQIVENVLHELEEAFLLKEGKRFANTKEPQEYASVNCIFVFTHMEFQLMCRDIGIELAEHLPELYQEWIKLNKLYNKEKKKLKEKQKKKKKKKKKN